MCVWDIYVVYMYIRVYVDRGQSWSLSLVHYMHTHIYTRLCYIMLYYIRSGTQIICCKESVISHILGALAIPTEM